MPRAKRQETARSILLAAWDLFQMQGFDGTSFTDLAKRSGVSRPLVQRYYPQKCLLLETCVQAIREASARVAEQAYPQVTNPIERLRLMGQINIAAFFATLGSRRLMRDVLSSRELTRRNIAESFLWTLRKTLPEHPELAEREEPDELIMAMGGLYELLYAYLESGRTPDVAAVTAPSIETFCKVYCLSSPAEEPVSAWLDRLGIARERLEELAMQALSDVPKVLVGDGGAE